MADAGRSPHPQSGGVRLATQTKLFDEGPVAGLINLLDIVEQAAAGRNQLQQAATRVIVLTVALEVLGQVGNALGQDGNLNFRRTSVIWLDGIFLDQRGFALSSNRPRSILSKEEVSPRPGCRPGGAVKQPCTQGRKAGRAYRANGVILPMFIRFRLRR
jgi:hypothetical protein